MSVPLLRSPERILNKALELFSIKGYEATSVREVCEAAGITKPTLYYFYGSKEGVYRALVEGALDDFRRDLLQRLQTGTAREKLKNVARGYFEHASGQRELMKFIFSLVYNPSSSAPKTDFPRFYAEVVGLIARSVEDGVASGELLPGPADVRMFVFMGALGEAVTGSLIVGRPDLTPELADTLVDTIIEGWSKR